MEIVIGSASWRSHYGNFNKNLLSPPEMRKLLAKSFELGINDIDTAPSYGDCENKLGLIQPSQRISSKLILTHESDKQVEVLTNKQTTQFPRSLRPTLFFLSRPATTLRYSPPPESLSPSLLGPFPSSLR